MAGENLLIVEDEKLIQQLLSIKLGNKGFHLSFVDKIEQVVQVLDAPDNKTDAIISDVILKGKLTGLDLLGILQERLSNIPVILITGSIDIDFEGLYAQGVSAILRKPFREEDLFSALEEILLQPGLGQQRRFDRYDANLSVHFSVKEPEEDVLTKTMNIGRGGMFVHSRQPYELNTIIKFEIAFSSLNQGTHIISGLGKVVWIRESSSQLSPGMGIRFLNLSDDARSFINRFIKKYKITEFIPRGQDDNE